MSNIPLEQQTMSFPEAYGVVWQAGNTLLQQNHSPHMKALMGERLMTIFDRIHQLEAEAEEFNTVVGQQSAPSVSLGSLVESLYVEERRIGERERQLNGITNPFAIQDDALLAIASLKITIGAAYEREKER